MKYIQSRFTYMLAGIIVIIGIVVACSETIKTTSEPVGVEELTQSAEFQSVVSDIKQLNAPLVKKMQSMNREEIKAFKEDLSSYIDRSGSKKKVTGNPEQLVRKIGYKDIQHYKDLSQSLRNKVEKLHETYPELKEGTVEKGNIKEAAIQILKKNSPKKPMDRGDVTSSYDPDEECIEQFYEDLEDATVQFAGTTAMCIVAGTFGTFVSGLACQVVNIGIYDTMKYLAAQNYWECTGCMDHCQPPDLHNPDAYDQ